ncbi:MAG: sterol desaturase family protein [Planctomycetes bacterium]|nr:sterol desaturase family protein [Planctomycetota bacterium]
MVRRPDLRDRLYEGWLCSRPFWVYPPMIVAMAAWAGPRTEWTAAVGLFGGGLAAWTLVEWGLHRLMHVPTRSPGFRRFQEFAHLRHHREPDNLPGSIVRLRGSLALAVAFLALALAAFQTVAPAMLFHAGLTAGYVWYEVVHFATHARWRLPGLAWLQRYHALHHSRQWNRAFGVTCPLWDWVFETLPR